MFEFLTRLVADEKKRCQETYEIIWPLWGSEEELFILQEDAHTLKDTYETEVFSEYPEDFSYEAADKVNYTMACIINLIGRRKTEISPQDPLRLDEFNLHDMLYLWTSAMVLGSLLPKKFDDKSVHTSYGTMDSQMGWFSRFSDTSLYEAVFKKYLNEEKIIEFHQNRVHKARLKYFTYIEEQKQKLPAVIARKERESAIEQQKQAEMAAEKKRQQELAAQNEKIAKERAAKKRQEELAIQQQKEEKLAAEQKKQEKLAAKKMLEEQQKAKNQNLLNSVCQFDIKISDIEQLLTEGALLDYQDNSFKNGYTALMLAIDFQNERMAIHLLKKGANLFLVNNYGHRAIDLIAENTYLFQLITQKMKEIELQKMSPELRATKALFDEVSSLEPKTQKIKQYLAQGADINYSDTDGYTPLMIAVDRQNDRIAEYLLNQGADPFIQNLMDEIASDLASRNSPIFSILKGYELLYAVLNSELETVKALLCNGADLNFQGLGGYTPILIAVEQGAFELVAFLLSKDVDLTRVRKDGQGVLDLVKEEAILELLNQAHQSTHEDIDEPFEEAAAPNLSSAPRRKTSQQFF